MIKKVLILGGSSDIGIELANKFSDLNKYKLSIHYFSNSKIKKKINFKCNFIKCDLSTKNEKKIINKFENNYDIIINLVGDINCKSFEKFSIDSIEKNLRTNSLMPFLIFRKSTSNMVKKKWGRIINSSSIGVKFGGGEQTFEYSISKHLNEFIPSFYKKISKYNIFYNVIKIGLTNTKIHNKVLSKNILKRKKLVPMKKMAEPKDIANYIFFLISNKNQFITNEVISISGGE